MKREILNFLKSEIFIACILSLIIAQIIKAILMILKSKRYRKNLLTIMLWETGGMPSSHSATVTSLVTSIALKDGTQNTTFIVALIFALITIRDAVGVRYNVGIQAEYINKIYDKVYKEREEDSPIRIIKGHKKFEALVGIFIGIVVSILNRKLYHSF